MPDDLRSRNFECLRDYDPLLVEYGLRAELYANSDPNASLLKSRQLAEVLAKSTACHAGMDCTENTFEETVGVLRRQRIVTQETISNFTIVRLAGNAAAHKHENDRVTALQSLICAYELAKWFTKSVLDDSTKKIGAFKPPPVPEDATRELREEIDFLREESAKAKLAESANEAEVRKLKNQLEQEAADYHKTLSQKGSLLRQRDDELAGMEQRSKERLKQILPMATSKSFRSFVYRSKESAERTGTRDDSTLPLTQIRLATGLISHCCNVDMVIAQVMSGGFIKQCCPACNDKTNAMTLARDEFFRLDVYLACAKCQRRAKPTMIGNNYGYRCGHCGWSCELVSLVPHYDDIGYESE